jgi:hypothetical protein
MINKKLIFIFYIFVILFLNSCHTSYKFLPKQSSYLQNIIFNNVSIKFEEFTIYHNKSISILLEVSNKHNKELHIKNDIKIVGKFYKCNKIYGGIGYQDLISKKYGYNDFLGNMCKLTHKELGIEIECIILEKNNMKDIPLYSSERFKVKLPTFVIDGKEYEFDWVDFVYVKD